MLQYLSPQFPLKILQPQSRGQGRMKAAVTGEALLVVPQGTAPATPVRFWTTSLADLGLLSLLTEIQARISKI